MIGDVVGFFIAVAPVAGLLMGRGQVDRRQRAADLICADIHVGVTRVLDGESLVAIQVECPTRWRAGRVRLAVPAGYAWLIGLS